MQHSALTALAALTRDYPASEGIVKKFRGMRDSLPHWPEHVFLPMAGWYAIASSYLTGGNPLSLAQSGEVSRLAAIGTWRYTQGIYSFGTEFRKHLWNAPLEGDIPVETLHALPEWSVYIETPGLRWHQYQVKGFWSHLEWDVNSNHEELRLLLDTDVQLIPIPLHLRGDIHAAIEGFLAEARKNNSPHVDFDGDIIRAEALFFQRVLSLVICLCKKETKIVDLKGATPTRPAGLIPNIPKTPRLWRVEQ